MGEDNNLIELDRLLQKVVDNETEYKTEIIMDGILDILQQYPQQCYYFLTFLLHLTRSSDIFIEVIQLCIEDNELTIGNKYFLYYQLITYAFLMPELNEDETDKLLYQLYQLIYMGYRNQFGELQFVPKEERNSEFVMVFISQVLGMGHGPTKTLLDRCHILQKYMNKKVFVVNTAEFRPSVNSVPVFRGHNANYLETLSDCSSLEYRGIDIPFFQCPQCMPDIGVMEQIIGVVRTEKPYYIVSIGGNSILSDLCSNIVPTITIGTVFSGRPTTEGTFLAIGRKKNQSDELWMKRNHKAMDCIIESLFTFSFREQEHTYSRKQLGLPDDRFIVLIVGGRLDEEIDNEFCNLLYELIEKGIYIAFLGTHLTYEKEFVRGNETYKNNSLYMGFQDDVLAIDECCDLYVNPMRLGGGGSAAEAMYKGLPVVTFDYGDVGVVAGKEFHVNSYEEMSSQIMRYRTDQGYYDSMSERARKRAEELLDSKTQFMAIIEKAMQSPRF